MTRFSRIAICVVVAGCEPAATEQPSPIGLASVDVQESDARLDITGYDGSGGQIARLELTLGRFTLEDDGREVDGRQVTVEVFDQALSHESEGFGPLRLPLPQAAEVQVVNQFLIDPRVRPVLARWGVAVEPRQPWTAIPDRTIEPEESAYWWTCTYSPTAACNASLCDESVMWTNDDPCQGGIGVMQYVCCAGTHTAAMRYCGMGASNPCGPEGNGGCASCWSYPYYTDCATWISDPQYAACEQYAPMWFPYVTAGMWAY